MSVSVIFSMLQGIQTHKKWALTFGFRLYHVYRPRNPMLHRGHIQPTSLTQIGNVNRISSSVPLWSKNKSKNKTASITSSESSQQLAIPLVAELYLDDEQKHHSNDHDQAKEKSSKIDRDLGKLSSEFMESTAQYEVEETGETTSETTAVFGTPNPNIPISSVPCPGCGARLHCQDPAIPGYMPSQRFIVAESKLHKSLCQRCIMMRKHNLALNVSVKPEEYTTLISTLRTVEALAIVVVDVMDMTNSIFPELSELIGYDKPLYIVGNKVRKN